MHLLNLLRAIILYIKDHKYQKIWLAEYSKQINFYDVTLTLILELILFGHTNLQDSATPKKKA